MCFVSSQAVSSINVSEIVKDLSIFKSIMQMALHSYKDVAIWISQLSDETPCRSGVVL